MGWTAALAVHSSGASWLVFLLSYGLWHVDAARWQSILQLSIMSHIHLPR